MRTDRTTDVTRATASWHLRPWPGDRAVAHLITDHLAALTADDFTAAIAAAARHGRRAVRTSALFPEGAELATTAGFEVIDTLALLRLNDFNQPASRRSDPPLVRCQTMHSWHHRRAARIDQLAFGRTFGNTPTSLGEILSATPRARGRYLRAEGKPAGFIIAGASHQTGYLQRLAVHPNYRRRGLARTLVADALHWLTTLDRNPIKTVLVNTGIDNQAGLNLYRGFGFESTSQRLVIAEFRLDTRRSVPTS